MRRQRKIAPRRLLGALLLLLLLAALLPLGAFLAGLLPGGGRLPAPRKDARGTARHAGTLEITVLRADDHAPVEGADILVEGTGEAAARSDAAGKAIVDGVGGGPVRVEATVAGRRTVAWTDAGTATDLLLAIEPERVRRGTVRAPDGTPAPGIEVALLDAEGRVLERSESDAEGRYGIPDRPGAAAVCTTDARYAPAAAPDGDLALEGGAVVEGRLAGAAGGELLVYARLPAPRDDATLPLRAAWPVGPDGAFSGRLPEGVQAWGVYGGLPVRLAAGEIALPERVDAEGRVARTDGTGVPGAVLTLAPLLDGGLPAPLPPVRIEAGPDGVFRAEGLAAVRYAAEVAAPGCATRVFPEVDAAAPLAFTLDEGFELQGAVFDTAGLPVAGARVQAVGLPQEPDGPVAETRADSDGRFRVGGLGGTCARLRVTAPGCFPTTLERVAPARVLRITLQRR